MNGIKEKYYDYEYIDYLDNNIKVNVKDFSLVRDFVIKEILSKNTDIYKEILILLINDVIKLNIDDTIITLNNNELGKSNYKEYNKTVDSYVSLNKNIHIDFECNTLAYNQVMLRNILYLYKISTKILESGNNISNLKDMYLIQVNINTSSSDNKFGYEYYRYVGKYLGKELTFFSNILNFNLAYYRNLFYNDGVKNLKKFEMWLVVFTSKNFKELYETLNYVTTENKRDKIIKDVIEMFSDGFRICDWEKEKMTELVRKAQYDYIEEVKIETKLEGKLEGKLEEIINTVKSMLREKCPLDLISRVTGKSVKEIKEIRDSM